MKGTADCMSTTDLLQEIYSRAASNLQYLWRLVNKLEKPEIIFIMVHRISKIKAYIGYIPQILKRVSALLDASARFSTMKAVPVSTKLQ